MAAEERGRNFLVGISGAVPRPLRAPIHPGAHQSDLFCRQRLALRSAAADTTRPVDRLSRRGKGNVSWELEGVLFKLTARHAAGYGPDFPCADVVADLPEPSDTPLPRPDR